MGTTCREYHLNKNNTWQLSVLMSESVNWPFHVRPNPISAAFTSWQTCTLALMATQTNYIVFSYKTSRRIARYVQCIITCAKQGRHAIYKSRHIPNIFRIFIYHTSIAIMNQQRVTLGLYFYCLRKRKVSDQACTPAVISMELIYINHVTLTPRRHQATPSSSHFGWGS